MKIDLHSPVEAWRVEVPPTGYPSCEVTLFNLTDRQVVSVEVTLLLSSREKDSTARLTHRGYGLTGSPHRAFTMTVPVDEPVPADTYEVIIEKVWYDNSSVWRRERGGRVEYTPNNLHRSVALSQLREVAGDMASGYPQEQGELWLCVCGRPNAQEDRICARCLREKSEVFARFSQEAVEAVIRAREDENARRNRAVLERNFAKEERPVEHKRRHPVRTAVLILAAVAVIGSVGAYGVTKLLIPHMKYQQALELLQAKEYARADEAFTAIADYRDAAERAMESRYLTAADLITSTDLAARPVTVEGIGEAREIFRKLGTYHGAASLLPECDYQEAMLRMSTGDYSAAQALFQGLGTYKDAPERVKETEYQLLKMQVETAEDYEPLRASLAALGDYQDAPVLLERTWLLEAEEALSRGDAVSALACVAEIPDNEEGQKLARQAHYRRGQALRAEGDIAGAAAEFYQAIGYQDAETQANECFYSPALEAYAAGNYARAAALFEPIREYRDAGELWNKSVYEQAKAAMTALDFTKARGCLDKLAEDYEDTATLKKDCTYLPAISAYTMGHYEEAISGFAQVPGHRDADDMILRARFEWAKQKAASGDYDGAISLYEGLGEYPEASEGARAARYEKAQALQKQATEDSLREAANLYAALDGYEKSQTFLAQTHYALAGVLLTGGKYEEAREIYVALSTYEESEEKVLACDYGIAGELAASGEREAALALYASLSTYGDAHAQWQALTYEKALEQLETDPLGAAALLKSAGDYQDAQERMNAAYDAYYGQAAEAARSAWAREDWEACLAALAGIDLENLPERYADLKEMQADCLVKLDEEKVDALYGAVAEAAQLAFEQGDWEGCLAALTRVSMTNLPEKYASLKDLREEALAKAEEKRIEAEKRAAQERLDQEFGPVRQAAQAAYDAGNYAECLLKLAEVDLENLPESYADLKTLRQEAEDKAEQARQAAEKAAAEKRYDAIYGDVSEEAQAAYDAGEYEECARLLSETDLTNLPEKYAYLATLNRDAQVKAAEKRVDDLYGPIAAAAQSAYDTGDWEGCLEALEAIDTAQLPEKYASLAELEQRAEVMAEEKRLDALHAAAQSAYDQQDYEGCLELLADLPLAELPEAHASLAQLQADALVKLGEARLDAEFGPAATAARTAFDQEDYDACLEALAQVNMEALPEKYAFLAELKSEAEEKAAQQRIDALYAPVEASARQAYAEGDYDACLAALETVDLENLPEKYASLKQLREDARVDGQYGTVLSMAKAAYERQDWAGCLEALEGTDLTNLPEKYQELETLRALSEQKAEEARIEAMYGQAAEEAQAALEEGDAAACVAALHALDLENLPEKYASLAPMYREACLAAGNQLYEAGDVYGAYPYYQQVAELPEVRERLKETCYLLLGTWRDPMGRTYTFKADGTCVLDGETLFFALDGLAVRTGTAPERLTLTHHLLSMGANSAWLSDERTTPQTRIYLTRVE